MTRAAQKARMDTYVMEEVKANPFAADKTLCREDRLKSDLSDWLAKVGREQRFGLRVTAKMKPMDGEESRIAGDWLTDLYWSGRLTKAMLEAGRAEIERASRSFFANGKVAYLRANKNASGKRKKLLKRLIERDGLDCWLCGKEMPEFDRSIEHLEAKSLGGTNHPSNLRLTHTGCNRALGNMTGEKKRELRALTNAGIEL